MRMKFKIVIFYHGIHHFLHFGTYSVYSFEIILPKKGYTLNYESQLVYPICLPFQNGTSDKDHNHIHMMRYKDEFIYVYNLCFLFGVL